MLDLLKFGISAQDKWSGQFGKMRKELGGVKGALAGLNDHARRTGRSMRNIGAGMAAGITAPLALLGKQSLGLYQTQIEAEKAVAQAITSTGSAAGKTLGDLKGLASGLQEVTTFGDEDILRNVTAPLLTFTKIQGDVFDRAQSNVLDMATLLKMDLRSASVLVGKALNDPIKGISALGRSGVQFSDDQKKVIKALVETGDVAGAQALILQELETQFKGQAAAVADSPMGQWRQLSNAIGDVKEQLGEQIVPFLKPLMDNVKGAVQWFADLSPEVKRNVVVFGGLAAAAGPVLAFLGAAVIGVTALSGVFASLGAVLLANPIGLAIAAIAAGAYLIYRNWEGVSAWFTALWGRVRSVTAAAWDGLKSLFLNYTAAGLIYQNWENIGVWFTTQWDAVRGSILLAWDAIKALLSGTYSPQQLIYDAWQGLGAWFAALAPELTAAFGTLWDAVKAEVSQWPGRMIQFGKDAVNGLIDGLLSGEPSVGSASRKVAREAERAARDQLQTKSPSRVFRSIGQDVAAGLGLGIADGTAGVMAEAQAMAKGVADVGEGAMGFVGTLRDGIKGAFKSILTGASSFRESLSSILSSLGGKLIDSGVNLLFDAIWPFAKGGVVSGGRVQAFASGGVVSSPTAFPMRGGMGLMGEAGPEAIMPLSRGGDGKLGVVAQGGGGSQRIELVLRTEEGVTVEQVEGIASNVAIRTVQIGAQAQARSLNGRLSEAQRRGTTG